MGKRWALVALTVLFGMAMAFNAQAVDKIKVGTVVKNAPEYYLPLDAATERGFWKDNGLEVEVVPFMAGAPFGQAMAAGSINAGASTGGFPVFLASQGIPVHIISELITKAPFIIYVRGDSKLKEPKDLAGAKIGVPRFGGASEFLARAVVRRFGIEKEVKIVAAGGLSEIFAGLKTGVLDAMVQPPTVVVELKVKGQIRQIADTADFLPKEWVEHVFIARREFTTRSPEVARRAVKAFLQGLDYVKKNPSWARDKMKVVSSFSEEGAKEIYDFIKWTKDGKISRVSLENVINFMIEWKIVSQEKVPPLDQLYTEQFLK